MNQPQVNQPPEQQAQGSISDNISELVIKLEAIVGDLENDRTPIETAFNLFEEGAEIANQLNQKISGFEKKLKILQNNIEIKEINKEDLE